MRLKIFEIARSRKTVRKFKAEKPPLSMIESAVECAKEAPSGMNAQPWLFLVIEDRDVKRRIRRTCERAEKEFYEKVSGRLGDWLKERNFTPEKPFLEEAPYLIAVFGDPRYPFWKESVWISVGYLLLALEELGLGSVTYTPPNMDEVGKILIPKLWKLQTIIPVGYPDDPKEKYERKSLEEVMRVI